MLYIMSQIKHHLFCEIYIPQERFILLFYISF